MTVHHHGHGSTIVREDRDTPATALIAVLAVLLVGFLIWFFAFSGVVFNRHPSTTGGTTTQNQTTNQTTVQESTGASAAPSPASS